MTWSASAPQGNECRKTRWRAVPFTRGKGVDLGCGPEKFMDTAHVIGVDSGKDTDLFGIPIKPDIKADITKLDIFASSSMDFAFSSHCAEHIDYDKVPALFREWMRVVRVGGHLCLYLPASGLYPDPGEPGANPDHKWAVTFDAVLLAMVRSGCGFDLVEYELCSKDDEYSHWFVFRKDKNPNKQARSYALPYNPQGLPTACVVRYGAFGDTVQAASVCATLKKQGYHVTLLCTYPASEVVAFDPNIDKLIVQLNDQIPMNWLGHYWVWLREKHRGKGFDRWINLTESVEGNLLAVEGNVKFEWRPKARHLHMNHNYLEFQHTIAGLPYEPSFTFHPTEEEKTWAVKEREKMRRAGIDRFVLWGLAGSSRTHKLYPHMDGIWRNLLKRYPGWGVVTTGDGSCVDLEAGWEAEPRVWRTSGKWNIRQVFTMLDRADVVVGPETGLMSAAAFYPMPKIVLLSHSTIENLTRDWVNTTSIWAPETHCPGRGANEVPACHGMIPRFEPMCRRHETFGTAQCVAEIKPEWVWHHLQCAMVEGAGGTWTPPTLIIEK